MRVVLLSASTGNGHMAAAYALEREFSARGHDATTVDVLDHTGRAFRGWYRGGYEVLVQRRPSLWGRLYRASDRPLAAYQIQTALDSLFVERMRRALDSWRPDWVVCTHSLPQPALARWRRGRSFRFAIVVTDLYPQRMWLRGRPDYAFVPTQWSLDVLARRNPGLATRAEVVGIPVDPAFRPPASKEDAKRALGLEPDGPAVLVTAGGIGGGPIEGAIRAMRDAGLRCRCLVVCGRNEEAFRRASAMVGGASEPRLTVHGHVDTPTMVSLLQAADLLVAKPGGITTFEALAAGVPFVVFRPFLIPGQEERNAAFLEEAGAGVVVDRAAALPSVVGGLLQDPVRREAMGRAALSQARPDSAALVAARLEGLETGMVRGEA